MMRGRNRRRCSEIRVLLKSTTVEKPFGRIEVRMALSQRIRGFKRWNQSLRTRPTRSGLVSLDAMLFIG